MSAWRWLCAILATAGVGAVASGYFAHGVLETQTAAYSTVVYPIYILTYSWMKADAHRRATQAPPGAIPLIAVLMPIAVPYYLIWTRRGWHKASALMFLCLYLLGVSLTMALGEMLGRRLAS